MIKDISKYLIAFGLLYGGHYFLSVLYPELNLLKYRDVTQLFLVVLALVSHFSNSLLSSKFKVLPGQVFLVFSVLKFILAGLYIFFLKKLLEFELSKAYILIFMAAYFCYLSIDVIILTKSINKKEGV